MKGRMRAVLVACAAAIACCCGQVTFADHFNDYLVTEGEPCRLTIGSSTAIDGEFEVDMSQGSLPAGLEFSTEIQQGSIYLVLSGTPERAGSYTFLFDWTDSKYHIIVDHYTVRVTVRTPPVFLNGTHGFPG